LSRSDLAASAYRVQHCRGQVGPYNNPQETYNYYYLPFCQPKSKGEKPAHKWGGLGEVLQGNQLIDSQLELKFRSAPLAQAPFFHALCGCLLCTTLPVCMIRPRRAYHRHLYCCTSSVLPAALFFRSCYGSAMALLWLSLSYKPWLALRLWFC